ncbi:MAG: arabinan endo-1,5-alpha-L-arabinosidase [Chitinophagaceae bacterium]|nr:MAG: arabinan endo-1,5-alpha-L-arabinosidase [Chitinophagaceae bacterium]
MKFRIAFYSVLAIVVVSCANKTVPQTNGKQTSGNPVFPGWYADPEAIMIKDRAWIFPTFSAAYRKQVFMDAFSSKDLVNWTKHERIVDTGSIKWAYMAMWAPSLVPKDGRYYLFFSANDIQCAARRKAGGDPNPVDDTLGGIGIAVADKPEGPYKDYLGKPLINQYYNGAQPIDQTVFQDVDGQYYIFYGGWGRCNVGKLNKDFTGLVPFEDGKLVKEVTPKGYVEGPVMFRKNNKYYFMWSEGGWTGPDYRVAYAIADSPMGPFERIGTILQQDPSIATGAGHHSVLQVPGTDEWYIVYHRRPIPNEGRDHRVVCIDKMEFDEKGLIKPVKITNEGVKKVKLK